MQKPENPTDVEVPEENSEEKKVETMKNQEIVKQYDLVHLKKQMSKVQEETEDFE